VGHEPYNVGLFVVPMLFANLPTPAIAGGMAARLFSAQTGISVVCSLVLVVFLRSDKHVTPVQIVPTITMLALAGALLALLAEFGVSPHIVARENLSSGTPLAAQCTLHNGCARCWFLASLLMPLWHCKPCQVRTDCVF